MGCFGFSVRAREFRRLTSEHGFEKINVVLKSAFSASYLQSRLQRAVRLSWALKVAARFFCADGPFELVPEECGQFVDEGTVEQD
jgi:hypothetical protein